MIISDEQARLAAHALRALGEGGHIQRPEVSPELFDRVYAAVLESPETRSERVRDAKSHLVQGVPDSHEIAQKIVSRVISDSLR